MRLENCYHFDTEMFIRQLRTWRDEKKKLQAELDAITLLPSMNNESGVRGSDISEPTARIALRRMEITSQIDDIEECEAMYERAKGYLTPEELEIFQMFFEPKKPIWKSIDEYSGGNYVCRGLIYKRRRQVLEKLDGIIAGLLSKK